MKLLMFNTKEFWYKTYSKTIERLKDITKEQCIKESLIIFANVEKEDEEKSRKIIRKSINNIRWLAKKTGRKRIMLHSFAHLSKSKSSVEFAQNILIEIAEKLEDKGYEVFTTPFGYFLEFRIHVLGESLAKVWKSLT
ncbi:threonyl-tRNA synthetase editing domain-containing protein [Candidatus Bathyarchaeota archaeon]|nr:threonyl-tRNA synthetase editing domain-containing protein [Candidatus Bathyarchaeota archaeon]